MGLIEPVWRKSSHSGGENACVEVAVIGNLRISASEEAAEERLFALRDSKNPDGPRLYFTSREWEAFRRDVKSGMFEN